jgi:hypothetical protein
MGQVPPHQYDGAGRKLPTKHLAHGPVPYDHLARYVEKVRAFSMPEVRCAFDRLQATHWVFRGHADSRWSLSSSLERAAPEFRLDICGAENFLLSRFKSRAHLLMSNFPADDDDLEWLALMQHHGCPTRLLDVTASPYIALYFALENRNRAKNCAVWALNRDACDERAVERIRVLQEWARETIFNEEDLLRGRRS